MVSTSTKFALNKTILYRKSVSTCRNEAFDKKPVSANPKNRFYKFLSFHQQKKALNKTTRFVIYRESVSTGQNERFVEQYDFTEPKNCFHSNQCLPKIEENGFH